MNLEANFPMQPKTIRKHPRRKLALRIIREIRGHPANVETPNRATLRAVMWQLRKRLGSQSVKVWAYHLDLLLPRQSGSLSNLKYFGEAFEWETVSFIRAFLCPGEVVIDAGANVGMFTYAAAEVVGPTGFVLSIEPLAWGAATIRSNVARNGLTGSVTVLEAAVSDREGTVEFTADLDVSNHMTYVAARSLSTRSTVVRAVALDDVVPANREPVLVKIDVEGAEDLALTGFMKHLARAVPPVMIIEAHDHSLIKMGTSRANVLHRLDAAGYDICEYLVNERRLGAYQLTSTADVVAVHRTKRSTVDERLRQATGRFGR